MPWYRKTDGEVKAGEERVDDTEFKPEKLKEDITKDFDTRLTEFSTKQDEKLKPLLDMAANIERDRVEREKARKDAEAKKNKEDNELTSEDYMLDPAAATQRAIKDATSGQTKAILMLAAKGNIKDTLSDKEYYHGDIKSKVDAMVAQQTLEMQCRPDVVENCYKVIMADNMKDIMEGKIKAKTSSSMFESGSTGGHKGNSDEGANETLTADEKRAASNMGISEKDWVASRREMSFV